MSPFATLARMPLRQKGFAASSSRAKEIAAL